MKSIVLSLLILLMATSCYAEKYYVFIDNIGSVEKGQEAGQNEKGDVIAICPFTTQYKPTRAELSRYKIIVADLTQEEKDSLTESETKDVTTDGVTHKETIRARKRTVDIDKISAKQEEEVVKTIITNNLSVKSALSVSR